MLSINTDSDIIAGDLGAPSADIATLHRITYGATPSTIAYAKKLGMPAFINEQLNPNEADDELVHSKLASLTLQRHSHDFFIPLCANYETHSEIIKSSHVASNSSEF